MTKNKKIDEQLKNYEHGAYKNDKEFMEDVMKTNPEFINQLANSLKHAKFPKPIPFITFEGPDGAGKTTVLKAITPWLQEHWGKDLLITREPGGDDISEQIRNVILNPKNTAMNVHTELLLYEAARSQLVSEVLRPAIKAGKLVVCDRYVDSTTAYQGGGNEFSQDELEEMNEFATQGLMPELTIYFDVPVKVGLDRINQNRQDKQDRLDEKSVAYHEQVHQAYEKVIKAHPDRIHMIDGTQELNKRIEATKALIWEKFGMTANK